MMASCEMSVGVKVEELAWVDTQKQLKEIISILPDQFNLAKALLNGLSNVQPQRESGRVYSASKLDLEEVKALLQIDFDIEDKNYAWDIKEELVRQEEAWDSTWEFEAIKQIKSSQYYKQGHESLVRSIIDILLCGRLEHLKDTGANKHLIVSGEVNIQTKVRDPKALEPSGHNKAVINGRADWAIGYSASKKNLESKLIIIECKRTGSSSQGVAQLMCYLSGVQDARAAVHKTNHQVFGILTDSLEFRFALLDENRRMFLSDPLLWRTYSARIVAFVDHILEKAIESSPHTTPVKTRNAQLLNFGHHLHFSFEYKNKGDINHLLELKPAVRVDDNSEMNLDQDRNFHITINSPDEDFEDEDFMGD